LLAVFVNASLQITEQARSRYDMMIQMHSLCDLFLARRPTFRQALQTHDHSEIDRLCRDIGAAYLNQEDFSRCEKEIVHTFTETANFCLRDAAVEPFHSLPPSSIPRSAPRRPDLMLPAIAAAAFFALGILFWLVLSSFAVGLLFSIVFAILAFMLAWQYLPRYHDQLMRSQLGDATDYGAASNEAVQLQDQIIQDRLARLEALFRQLDHSLIQVHEKNTDKKEIASGPSLGGAYLEFIQDLAEAGRAEDKDYALSLARHRLPAVAQGSGIQLVEFSEGAAHLFAIDDEPEPARKGQVKTLRPALTQGEKCLLRGYARRSV
jgi:hypothetical protein